MDWLCYFAKRLTVTAFRGLTWDEKLSKFPEKWHRDAPASDKIIANFLKSRGAIQQADARNAISLTSIVPGDSSITVKNVNKRKSPSGKKESKST
jgi:hypothetical protein